MTMSYIFKRMRQQWRVLGILFIAVCLVTSFFALGPLYLRYTSEVLLRHTLNTAPRAEKVINISLTEPFTEKDSSIIQEQLGSFIQETREYQRGGYTPPLALGESPNLPRPPCITGDNDPDTFIDTTGYCLQPFGFGTYFEDLVTLVEGRFATPEILHYESREGQVTQFEVTVGQAVATEAQLKIGDKFILLGAPDELLRNSLFEITVVGIWVTNDPADPIWISNQMLVTGAEVDLSRSSPITRYDWGIALHPQAYDVLKETLVQQTTYVRHFTPDIEKITESKVQAVLDGFTNTVGLMQATRLDTVQATSGLNSLLRGYQNQLSNAEGAIIFLSGMMLLLMLYNLVTTTTLSFEAQMPEWGMLRSRGGGTFQLSPLQLIPAVLMAILAVFLTPFLGRGLLIFTQYMTGLGSEDSGERLRLIQNLEIPKISYYLSTATGILCVGVLAYPIYRSAQTGILQQKLATTRLLKKPKWMVIFLDGVLIVVGILFLVRLYTNNGGDLRTILKTPARLTRFIAENITGTQGLTDPFSLLAPVLILTGSAMLWLRVFPYMMRLLSISGQHVRKLGFPLAVWHVERNTNHYSQFVLLLIGTLAIGTASVSLQRTQEIGAWEIAQDEIGGYAQLQIDPQRFESQAIVMDSSIQNYTEVIDVEVPANEVATLQTFHVIGIDPESFSTLYPEISSTDLLTELPMMGLKLPITTAQFGVHMWSESIKTERYPEARVLLNAHLIDKNGFEYEVTLYQNPNRPETSPDEWHTMVGELPAEGSPPFYLWRLGMATTQGNNKTIRHIIYLKDWYTISTDGVTSDLAVNASQNWQPALSKHPFMGTWITPDPERDHIDGITMAWVSSPTGPETVLQVEYEILTAYTGVDPSEPSLSINTAPINAVPVLVSPEFTKVFRGQFGEPINTETPFLKIGDERSISLNLDASGNLFLGIHVIDILDRFPTLSSTENKVFMVMLQQTMRLLFNQQHSTRSVSQRPFVGINEVWMTLDSREPSSPLQESLETLPGVLNVNYAWTRYNDILRQPIPNVVAGMFYVGFWISLALSLLNFSFYMSVTAKQRLFSFGVLRSLGWNINNIWRLLFMEQTVLIIPAIFIGCVLGLILAYLLLPFLALPGDLSLHLPVERILTIASVLSVSFILLLGAVTFWLRQISLHQILRLGEE